MGALLPELFPTEVRYTEHRSLTTYRRFSGLPLRRIRSLVAD